MTAAAAAAVSCHLLLPPMLLNSVPANYRCTVATNSTTAAAADGRCCRCCTVADAGRRVFLPKPNLFVLASLSCRSRTLVHPPLKHASLFLFLSTERHPPQYRLESSGSFDRLPLLSSTRPCRNRLFAAFSFRHTKTQMDAPVFLVRTALTTLMPQTSLMSLKVAHTLTLNNTCTQLEPQARGVFLPPSTCDGQQTVACSQLQIPLRTA